jgi:hypothetical protein
VKTLWVRERRHYEQLTMVTALPSSKDELRNKASAISSMTRPFNLREGLTLDQGRLPNRLHRGILSTGQSLSEEEEVTVPDSDGKLVNVRSGCTQPGKEHRGRW